MAQTVDILRPYPDKIRELVDKIFGGGIAGAGGQRGSNPVNAARSGERAGNQRIGSERDCPKNSRLPERPGYECDWSREYVGLSRQI